MNNPRFTEESIARNLALLKPLEEIAQAHRAKRAQVALAWVLSRGENVVPIPGMRRRTHLDENVAAVDIELMPEEIDRLDAAFPPGAAAGERYTPEAAKWADRMQIARPARVGPVVSRSKMGVIVWIASRAKADDKDAARPENCDGSPSLPGASHWGGARDRWSHSDTTPTYPQLECRARR